MGEFWRLEGYARAYLAGVLNGDGWLSRGGRNSVNGYFGLGVVDHDFALAFASAIAQGYGIATKPGQDKRGYWVVRTYNGFGRFDDLRSLEPTSQEESAAWLRGLFDSEGNALLIPLPRRGPRSYCRRVAVYSTNECTLARTARYLLGLGMATRLNRQRPSEGHMGSKQVWELAIRSSRANYEAFAATVGSSIQRKQSVLDALAASYCDDLAAACREAGAAGAATKRTRAATVRLPQLLQLVADHTASGGKATYRELERIDGYWSARKTLGLTHSEIVEMSHKAKGDTE